MCDPQWDQVHASAAELPSLLVSKPMYAAYSCSFWTHFQTGDFLKFYDKLPASLSFVT